MREVDKTAQANKARQVYRTKQTDKVREVDKIEQADKTKQADKLQQNRQAGTGLRYQGNKPEQTTTASTPRGPDYNRGKSFQGLSG